MKTGMERVEKIRLHPMYKEAVMQIEMAERERIYCGHSPEHFLDVARIMYIRKLEQDLAVSKEIIYAAALLHDIGRAKQYTEGIGHDVAGALMAEQILKDCDFEPNEISMITAAIGDHRRKEEQKDASLAGLLKGADNLSRACYSCPAEATCKWADDRKNKSLYI